MHTFDHNPSRNAINLVKMGWKRGFHGWYMPNAKDQTEYDYHTVIEINAKLMAFQKREQQKAKNG